MPILSQKNYAKLGPSGYNRERVLYSWRARNKWSLNGPKFACGNFDVLKIFPNLFKLQEFLEHNQLPPIITFITFTSALYANTKIEGSRNRTSICGLGCFTWDYCLGDCGEFNESTTKPAGEFAALANTSTAQWKRIHNENSHFIFLKYYNLIKLKLKLNKLS